MQTVIVGVAVVSIVVAAPTVVYDVFLIPALTVVADTATSIIIE